MHVSLRTPTLPDRPSPPPAAGAEPASGLRVVERAAPLDYARLYDEHFDFVWRNARRLGVPEAAVDDAVQDVFIVAHRRLPDFEARSSVRTWLFGILLKVAKDYRRSEKRREAREQAGAELASLTRDAGSESPAEALARKQAAEIVTRLIESIDEEKRTVFVLVELEQLSVTDVAAAEGLNVNTAHARLRAARQQFEQAVARHRAQVSTAEKLSAWRKK
jgi:RNA polymerase sigma-70 factor (ECF subfamily)